MAQPRLDQGQAENLAMSAVPQEMLRRQVRGQGVAIDTARLDQGAVKQIGPQDVETTRQGLTVEGAHVALGTALDKDGGQVRGEGAPDQGPFTAAPGQVHGRERQAQFHHGLGQQRIEAFALPTSAGGLLKHLAVGQGVDLERLGGRHAGQVRDPGMIPGPPIASVLQPGPGPGPGPGGLPGPARDPEQNLGAQSQATFAELVQTDHRRGHLEEDAVAPLPRQHPFSPSPGDARLDVGVVAWVEIVDGGPEGGGGVG